MVLDNRCEGHPEGALFSGCFQEQSRPVPRETTQLSSRPAGRALARAAAEESAFAFAIKVQGVECFAFERGPARWFLLKLIPVALAWTSAAQKLNSSPSNATAPNSTVIASPRRAMTTKERSGPSPTASKKWKSNLAVRPPSA